MMPECLATDKRRIKANLTAASKMDDPVHTSKCIVKEIADAHKPGFSPAMTITAKQFADMTKAMKSEAKAAAVAAVANTNASATGTGGNKAPGGAKKGKWAQKLPNGQKCSKGTCVCTSTMLKFSAGATRVSSWCCTAQSPGATNARPCRSKFSLSVQQPQIHKTVNRLQGNCERIIIRGLQTPMRRTCM